MRNPTVENMEQKVAYYHPLGGRIIVKLVWPEESAMPIFDKFDFTLHEGDWEFQYSTVPFSNRFEVVCILDIKEEEFLTLELFKFTEEMQLLPKKAIEALNSFINSINKIKTQ